MGESCGPEHTQGGRQVGDKRRIIHPVQSTHGVLGEHRERKAYRHTGIRKRKPGDSKIIGPSRATAVQRSPEEPNVYGVLGKP